MPGALFGPAPLALLLITTVPGLVLGLALGIRGWLLAAASPLLTYGLVGAAGSTLPLLGIRWSPMTLAMTTTVTAIAALAARLTADRLRSPLHTAAEPRTLPPWSAVHHLGVLTGAVTAAGIGAAATLSATGNLAAVPQVWDSVFHSNAIRYIADSGLSDPAALRHLNDPDVAGYFYPNAYHVVAATAVMLTGAGVSTTVNATVVFFPTLLAVAMAALVRQTGGRPALAASAALLSCAFTALPYDLLPWGTLLPFITSLVLVPALLAVFVTILRDPGHLHVPLSVALGLSGVGLLALHPSGAVAAALLGIALLIQVWIQRGFRVSDVRTIGITTATAVVLGAPLLRASLSAASGPAFDWPTTLRPADAMGQLLFLSHEQEFPQYFLIALLAVGLFSGARLVPFLWLVLVSTLFAGLFVMAASYEGELVEALTRAWWNDKWRFAAIWTLGAIIVCAIGMVRVKDAVWAGACRLAPSMRSLDERRRLSVSTGLATLLVGSLIVASDGLYFARNESRLSEAFTDGPSVSLKEREAFEVLAKIVPEGNLVMNDSYDGSALMWALSGVRPVFASPVIADQELPTMNPDRRVLFESFNEVDTNARVRQALSRLNVSHVIICTGFIKPANDYSSGMQNIEDVAALRLVYENSDARVYELSLEEAPSAAEPHSPPDSG